MPIGAKPMGALTEDVSDQGLLGECEVFTFMAEDGGGSVS